MTSNNLHRELAPISDAAWADIETEARRTFEQHVAARRVVDLAGPDGSRLASVNTGHLSNIDAPADGVIAHLRTSQPLVRLRVPFTLTPIPLRCGSVNCWNESYWLGS